ncbi:unnamed protein product [Acanthosepion pharaonis]|uniref:Uncharacterized protein n=1 Tax=Acanthosepion pharaonis TaxID=158019 RepID=A0A812BXP8_ACAPH|nr:unnamed protein product [Sepia pharaonis]
MVNRLCTNHVKCCLLSIIDRVPECSIYLSIYLSRPVYIYLYLILRNTVNQNPTVPRSSILLQLSSHDKISSTSTDSRTPASPRTQSSGTILHPTRYQSFIKPPRQSYCKDLQLSPIFLSLFLFSLSLSLSLSLFIYLFIILFLTHSESVEE